MHNLDYGLIKSEASMGLHIEGESSFDAILLADTIKNFAEVAKQTASSIEPDAFVKINVTAFQDGSFDIAFKAVTELGNKIAGNPALAITLAATTVGAIKGILEI